MMHAFVGLMLGLTMKNTIYLLVHAVNSEESSKTHPEPSKGHPRFTHWSSRKRSDSIDSERVGKLIATSRHLRKCVVPLFEVLQFCPAVRMLPGPSRFWFPKDMQPSIILCALPSCGANGIRSTSLFEVRSHDTFMEGVYSHLGSLLFIPTTLDAYRMCNRVNNTVGFEGSAANYIRYLAWSSAAFDRSQSSLVRSAIIQCSVRKFGTFERGLRPRRARLAWKRFLIEDHCCQYTAQTSINRVQVGSWSWLDVSVLSSVAHTNLHNTVQHSVIHTLDTVSYSGNSGS